MSLELCYYVTQCIFCNDLDGCIRVGRSVAPYVITSLRTLPICVVKTLSHRKLARLALGVGCPIPIAVVEIETTLYSLALAACALNELASVCTPDVYKDCRLVLRANLCCLGLALLLGAGALGDRVTPLVIAVVVNAILQALVRSVRNVCASELSILEGVVYDCCRSSIAVVECVPRCTRCRRVDKLVERLLVPLLLERVVGVVVADKSYNLITLEVLESLLQVHLLLLTCIAEESAVCKEYDAVDFALVECGDILSQPIVRVVVEAVLIALCCVRVACRTRILGDYKCVVHNNIVLATDVE